jgi:hypothetical protein
MGNVLDVFAADAFSCQSMTDSLIEAPYTGRMVGELGLFEEEGIPTVAVTAEYDGQTIKLVGNTPRTAPAPINPVVQKKARTFTTTHLPLQDSVMADDVQNKRAWGSNSDLETVSQAVARKLKHMRNNLEAMREWLRVGAVTGKIYDSDGTTVIYNLFTEFGVTQDSVNFSLGTATTDVRGKCTAVARHIADGMGGIPYTGIAAICGNTWYDAFVSHALVRDTYANWETNAWLRADVAYSGFRFAGIDFYNYRGAVAGKTYVAAGEANFFPTGSSEVFKGYNAPANYVETANTIGIPMYAKSEIMSLGKGMLIEAQANPLFICHRPDVLVKGTNT